jgi:O-methyltransferase
MTEQYFVSDIVPDYHGDQLAVWHKNVDFLKDPRFISAYDRGMASGHHIGRNAELPGNDLHIEWRVHVLTWAAEHALKLAGDFVECGVNTGIYSLAICEFLDFNRTGRSFYLFDTFNGLPLEQISPEELALGRVAENEEHYSECYEIAKRNFAPFPSAKLIRGKVPDTLRSVDIPRVCYLSIDMNIAAPEIAALEYFWDRLSPGAPVILDDYGWSVFKPQKEAMDRFAAEKEVAILNLPTGQGLILKPS